MKDTEEIVRRLHAYLAEHGQEHETPEAAAEAFLAMLQHSEEGPALNLPVSDRERAGQLLSELQFARTEKEYRSTIKRALELDPENIDARIMALDEESLTYLTDLAQIVEEGRVFLEKAGFTGPDAMGSYWLISETRPFVRAKRAYANALYERRMKRKAAEQLEELLQLNQDDNTGARYDLMSVYNDLEQLDKAKELYQRYPEASAFMLLPLILSSLKAGDELGAKRFYKQLMEANKGCRIVFGKRELDFDAVMDASEDQQYALGSAEELYLAIEQSLDDFMDEAGDYYYAWLRKNLNKPQRKTMPKKKA